MRGSESRAIYPPVNESFPSCRSCTCPPAALCIDAGRDGWPSPPAPTPPALLCQARAASCQQTASSLLGSRALPSFKLTGGEQSAAEFSSAPGDSGLVDYYCCLTSL